MQLQENISLLPYNTFGLDVSANYFCIVNSKDVLLDVIQKNLPSFKKILILGGGSNVLFCNDFDGLVIKNEIKGIEVIQENEQYVWIKSYSGTIWQELVLFCIQNNYGGIENMSLIPGTVGAAPIQNIGAYGVELKDVFIELEAIDLQSGAVQIFSKEACHFGYRDSIFKQSAKGLYFIYSITLKLSKYPEINTSYGDIEKTIAQENIMHPTIKDVSDAVIKIRQSKLPDYKFLGNAGSFFKNPEISKADFEKLQSLYPNIPNYILPNGNIKIPAAWLIEQCGWKGKQIGQTGNHAQQALVIVNYGKANGKEIWQHAQRVQASILQQFGISVEMEVNIVQ